MPRYAIDITVFVDAPDEDAATTYGEQQAALTDGGVVQDNPRELIDASELEAAERELTRLKGYQAREPRRFGREGTWDQAVERAESRLAKIREEVAR